MASRGVCLVLAAALSCAYGDRSEGGEGAVGVRVKLPGSEEMKVVSGTKVGDAMYVTRTAQFDYVPEWLKREGMMYYRFAYPLPPGTKVVLECASGDDKDGEEEEEEEEEYDDEREGEERGEKYKEERDGRKDREDRDGRKAIEDRDGRKDREDRDGRKDREDRDGRKDREDRDGRKDREDRDGRKDREDRDGRKDREDRDGKKDGKKRRRGCPCRFHVVTYNCPGCLPSISGDWAASLMRRGAQSRGGECAPTFSIGGGKGRNPMVVYSTCVRRRRLVIGPSDTESRYIGIFVETSKVARDDGPCTRSKSPRKEGPPRGGDDGSRDPPGDGERRRGPAHCLRYCDDLQKDVYVEP